MYAKIFEQMYDGSLCNVGPWQALVTFQQMLVLADQDGVVDMTPIAIARRTTIPLEIIETGISVLVQPDPESRTPTEEGRRLVLLTDARSWGWRIVNYRHYRQLKRESERRDYHREYWHERKQKPGEIVKINARRRLNEAVAQGRVIRPSHCQSCGGLDHSLEGHHADYAQPLAVTWLCRDCHNTEHHHNAPQQPQPSQPIAYAEAYTDTKAIQKKGPTVLKKSPERPGDVCTEAWEGWIAHRKAKKAAITDRVISSMRKAASDAGMTLEQAMDWSVQQNHQGFYPPRPGQNQTGETAYQRSMRLKMEQVCPAVAAKPPGYRPEVKRGDVIDMISQLDFNTDLLKRG